MLEAHVHVGVLLGQVAHLFHVDLLEQCAHVDALDQLQDDLLQLFVLGSQLHVVLLRGFVALDKLCILFLEALLLSLELAQSELLLDNLFLVGNAASLHLLGIFVGGLGLVLGVNLLVKHDLALFLLLGELFQHDFGVVALGLQLVLQFHCHLSLGLLELVLLVGVSDTATLDFVLKLQVFLVDTALLGEDVEDVGVAHLLLVFEVLNARFSD